MAKGHELGLVRGAIPEAYGGYGDARSAVTGAIVMEELAWGDLAIAVHLLAPRLLVTPLIEAGGAPLQQRWLPPLAQDQFVAATAALNEPRFDFDPAAMKTVARREGQDFVLSGVKCCVPLAQESSALLVYASGGSEGFDAVEGFVIGRETPGLEISPREENMGLKGVATYTLTLNDCRVDRSARLGGESGLNFTRLLSESRVAIAAMAVGVARAAFEYARDYARERKAFGVPIATKQAIAFMLAEMAIEIDAARLLVWEAAARLDKGENGLKESYQARNYAAQAALTVTDNAVQVLGGHGYIREHPVEMWLRNARGFAVLEGLATV